MSIFSSISRFAEYFKRNGLRATGRRFSLAVTRTLFLNRMALYYCDLTSQSSLTTDLPSSLKMERKRNETELDPEELQEIISVWNPRLARRNVEERFALGASLWLIKLDGNLAGYGWSLRGRTVEPHYFCLGLDDVHLFDFHVFPQYRGLGVNPSLVNYILRSLATESQGRAFIEAAEWNHAQLTSLRKTPFRRLGWARKRSIGGLTIVWWAENDAARQKQGPKSASAADRKAAGIPHPRG